MTNDTELNDLGYSYLRALVDPFNSDPTHNICSKRAPCNLYKVNKTIFGKVLGTGGVFINPHYLPFQDAVNPIMYTDGSAAITTIPTHSTSTMSTTGIATTYISNAPYTGSTYTSPETRMFRLVSAAVKVKYIGKAEYIGGTCYPFSNQVNFDMSGFTLANLKMREDLIRTDFTNQEVCSFYTPYNTEVSTLWKRYSASTSGHTYTQDSSGHSGVNIGIFIESQEPTSTTAIPFQIDVACIFECMGIHEKQSSFYPADEQQYNLVLSILDGPRAWVGSPSTVKLNPVDYVQRPVKAFNVGGILRQDMPLYYVLDEDKPISIKNEAGDVLTTVSKKKHTAFITGDREGLREAEYDDENVEYEGGVQVYKGTHSNKHSNDESESLLLLEDIFSAFNVPTLDVQKKRKRAKSIDKDY